MSMKRGRAMARSYGPERPLCSGPLLFPVVGVCLRLQPVQIVHSPLRVAGSGEDEALVALQHRQPAGDVGGMVGPHLRRDAQIRTKKGAAQFRTQLLTRIAFVAVALPPEIARQPLVVLRPVGQFVGERRRVALGVAAASTKARTL